MILLDFFCLYLLYLTNLDGICLVYGFWITWCKILWVLFEFSLGLFGKVSNSFDVSHSLYKLCLDSLFCLVTLTNTEGESLVWTLFSRMNYGLWSENFLIKTPAVVSKVLSVNLHRMLSIKVPLLFVSLVGTVIIFV